MDTCYCQSTVFLAGIVSVYSAMLDSQWYMLCVSHGVCVVDFPVVVQRPIPMVLTVQQTIETPKLLLNTVIDVPVVQGVQVVDIIVVVPRPFPMVQTVCRTKEIHLLLDEVVDVPVVQSCSFPGGGADVQ